LGRDAHRALVGVADAGHDAALRDQRDGPEAELLRPKRERVRDK
jgi:hypothetical protein